MSIRHKMHSILDLGISERSVMFGGFLLMIVAAVIGIYLGLLVSLLAIVPLIIVGAFLGVSYSIPPLKLRYRGIGEVLASLALGPLTGLGAFAVQVGYLSLVPFVNTIPNGCFTELALLSAGMLHRDTDALMNKRTLAVLLGARGSGLLAIALIGIMYSSLIASVLLNYLPMISLIALLTLPIAIYYTRTMVRGIISEEDYRKLRALWGGTFSVRVIYSAMIILSIIIAKVLG